MSQNIISVPHNAHVPPIIGEYGYHDSRLMNYHPSFYCTINPSDNSETYQRAVHYSMTENNTESIPFITNNGQLKSIDSVNNSSNCYRFSLK